MGLLFWDFNGSSSKKEDLQMVVLKLLFEITEIYYFYDQNLVICYKICLQTCFTNFLEGEIVEDKKRKFSHAKQIFFTFLEIIKNTNTKKRCQMFLALLKKY